MDTSNFTTSDDPIRAYARVLACKSRIGRDGAGAHRRSKAWEAEVSGYLMAVGSWVGTLARGDKGIKS